MPSRMSALIVAVLVVCAQTRLEPVRWWRSPRDAELVGLTPQQAMAIERLYQNDLPARNRASQEMTYLEGELTYSRQWDTANNRVRSLTEQLGRARLVDCLLRDHLLQRIDQLLSPRQREQLTGLVSQNRFMESTCSTVSHLRPQTSARSDAK